MLSWHCMLLMLLPMLLPTMSSLMVVVTAQQAPTIPSHPPLFPAPPLLPLLRVTTTTRTRPPTREQRLPFPTRASTINISLHTTNSVIAKPRFWAVRTQALVSGTAKIWSSVGNVQIKWGLKI
jgi:hypothetical protein